MNQAGIERRLWFLTVYAIGSAPLLLLVILVTAFGDMQQEHFEEIDVERINVNEPDGQPALVIANSRRLPGAVIDGQKLTSREGIPGIIFYNSEGDETGGLIFDTEKTDGTLTAFGHLSFGALRVFVGTQDETAALRLYDRFGNERIRMYVDSSGVARMEFLDDEEEVIYSVPQTE